jgi:hypothetical protein
MGVDAWYYLDISVEAIQPVGVSTIVVNASMETKIVDTLPKRMQGDPKVVTRSRLNRAARLARLSIQLLANVALRSEVRTRRTVNMMKPRTTSSSPSLLSHPLEYIPSIDSKRAPTMKCKKQTPTVHFRVPMPNVILPLPTHSTLIVDRSTSHVAAKSCVNVAYTLYGQHFSDALERGVVLSGDYIVVHLASHNSPAPRRIRKTLQKTERKVGAIESCSNSSSSSEDDVKIRSVRVNRSVTTGDDVINGSWAVARVASVDVHRGMATLRAVRYQMHKESKRLSGPPQLVGAPVSVPLDTCQWYLGARFPTSRNEITAIAAGLFFEYARDADCTRYYNTLDNGQEPPVFCNERGHVRVARAFWSRVPRGMRTLDTLAVSD